MSYFTAKMHQIRFQLGLRPDPAGGAYSASPDPLAGFKGPTSKGRGGEGMGWDRRAERGREGKGGFQKSPRQNNPRSATGSFVYLSFAKIFRDS